MTPPPRYQARDSYHAKAKREGYRSRAAYKLLDIQKAQKLLRKGQRVVDLGCWPGGWMQVAAEIVGRRGKVVGVDMARIEPPLELENAIAFEADLFDPETPGRILAELGGRAHVVLCDAAPKLTGIRERDRAAEENLLEAIEGIIPVLIQADGTLLVKLLECPEAAAFQRRIRKQFTRSQAARTGATRKGSSERYLLAKGFRAPAAEPGEPPGDPVE